MAATLLVNLIFVSLLTYHLQIVYGILVIRYLGDFANPYFALILVSLFANLINFPLSLVYVRLSRNILE